MESFFPPPGKCTRDRREILRFNLQMRWRRKKTRDERKKRERPSLNMALGKHGISSPVKQMNNNNIAGWRKIKRK